MPPENGDRSLEAQVRTMQMIVVALSLGVLTFGAFVAVSGSTDEQAELGPLSLGSVGLAVLGIAMSFVIPALLVSQNRGRIAEGTWQAPQQNRGGQRPPDTDEGKLVVVYQLQLIISAALLEGPAFLALMAYLLEGHWLGLLVAAVCLMGLMAKFPTRNRVEMWVDAQLQRVKELQQFRSQ